MGEEGYTGHNIPKTYPLITSTIVAMIGAMNISISITHLVFTYPFKFHYIPPSFPSAVCLVVVLVENPIIIVFLTISNGCVMFKFLSPSEGTSVVNGGFWNLMVMLCFYINLRQFAENDLTDPPF